MLLHDYHAHPWLLQLYETHDGYYYSCTRDLSNFFRGTPWPWRRCPRPPPPPPWSQNVSHERAHGMACFDTALRPDIAPPDLLTAAAAPLLGSWRFNLTFSPPMAFPPN